MSTQYRLVQSGKTASGGCSAGPRFVRAVAPRIIIIIYIVFILSIKTENAEKGKDSRSLLERSKYSNHKTL
jgi:hypothetical protein